MADPIFNRGNFAHVFVTTIFSDGNFTVCRSFKRVRNTMKNRYDFYVNDVYYVGMEGGERRAVGYTLTHLKYTIRGRIEDAVAENVPLVGPPVSNLVRIWAPFATFVAATVVAMSPPTALGIWAACEATGQTISEERIRWDTDQRSQCEELAPRDEEIKKSLSSPEEIKAWVVVER